MPTPVRAYQLEDTGGSGTASGTVDTAGGDLLLVLVDSRGIGALSATWDGTSMGTADIAYFLNGATEQPMSVFHVYAPSGSHTVAATGNPWIQAWAIVLSGAHQTAFLGDQDFVETADADAANGLTSGTITPASDSLCITFYASKFGMSDPPVASPNSGGTAFTVSAGNNPDTLMDSGQRQAGGIAYRTGFTSGTMGWDWTSDTNVGGAPAGLITFEVKAAAGGAAIAPAPHLTESQRPFNMQAGRR